MPAATQRSVSYRALDRRLSSQRVSSSAPVCGVLTATDVSKQVCTENGNDDSKCLPVERKEGVCVFFKFFSICVHELLQRRNRGLVF